MRATKPLSERFWKYVSKSENCWLWTGAQCKGYGKIGLGRKSSGLEYAHRVSWVIHFGAIPEGLNVLHHCDTPLCVKPGHLFVGTQAINHRDRVDKHRGNALFILAFGENKPLCAWLEDLRCAVTRGAIKARIENGWSPELAITVPPCPREFRHSKSGMPYPV